MRLFAALPMPEPVIEQLFSLRLRLSDAKDGLRWSTPEQWHLTLQFYDEVADDSLLCLIEALNRIVAPPVRIVLGGFGLFPAKGILYASVEASAGVLSLQRQVAEQSATCGFPIPTRGFHPHITLARSKGKTGDRSLQRLTRPQMPHFGPPLSWTACECLLLESTLRQTGAVYEVRERVPLCE